VKGIPELVDMLKTPVKPSDIPAIIEKIEQGADVNFKVNGSPLIFLAIQPRFSALLPALLKRGVNLSVKNESGILPMNYAINSSTTSVIHMLVEQNAPFIPAKLGTPVSGTLANVLDHMMVRAVENPLQLLDLTASASSLLDIAKSKNVNILDGVLSMKHLDILESMRFNTMHHERDKLLRSYYAVFTPSVSFVKLHFENDPAKTLAFFAAAHACRLEKTPRDHIHYQLRLEKSVQIRKALAGNDPVLVFAALDTRESYTSFWKAKAPLVTRPNDPDQRIVSRVEMRSTNLPQELEAYKAKLSRDRNYSAGAISVSTKYRMQ
jgi:hypothetical protein